MVLPRDRIKPPNAKSMSNANEPTVFATIIFLPAAPINRNNAEATWFTSTSTKYCLNNLQCGYRLDIIWKTRIMQKRETNSEQYSLLKSFTSQYLDHIQ